METLFDMAAGSQAYITKWDIVRVGDDGADVEMRPSSIVAVADDDHPVMVSRNGDGLFRVYGPDCVYPANRIADPVGMPGVFTAYIGTDLEGWV